MAFWGRLKSWFNDPSSCAEKSSEAERERRRKRGASSGKKPAAKHGTIG